MATTEIQEFTGKEIQGYKISKPIGQGKFSTVYKAETDSKSIVALKKIKIFDMMDPKQRDKCLKEVGLMKPLDHSNIIKYIDSFIHNNELIIVTEWAEKGDLKRLIKIQQGEETPFEEIRIWEYMQQIASALNHMHEKRIMHRDLKPANIFIAQDDSLKIGDLGLGREFSSGTIEVYSKVGTPLYMSPELLHGEGYDMKSDVWSLGCIIYELCEFKSPFRNENEKMSLMDLFQNITKGEYKKISKRYSEDMQQIIDQMIVVDPTKRIDTDYVLQKCNQIITQLKKSPKIDCILVNEDIYEKLTLLEYHMYFCKPMHREPVSKVFFSISDGTPAENNKKFFYFAELCYWIMQIQKYDKKNKIQAALKLKAQGVWDSVDECAGQLLFDLKKWGLRLPDTLTIQHIRNGYGDTVCFILNDILNRELIRLNFKFEEPKQINDNETSNASSMHDPVLQDDMNGEKEEQLEEDFDDEHGDLDDSAELKGFGGMNNDQIPKDHEVQEKSMIVGRVDSLEWQKELTRVMGDLQTFDSKLSRGELVTKNTSQPATREADYAFNLARLVRHSKVLEGQVKKLKEPFVNKLISTISQELESITKGETRINEGNLETLSVLKEKVISKKEFLKNLELRSETVKIQISKLDSLNESLEKTQKELSEKEKSITSNDRTSKIKTAIQQVKNEISSMDVKIGILKTTLLRKQLTHNNEKPDEDIDDLELRNTSSNFDDLSDFPQSATAKKRHLISQNDDSTSLQDY